MTGLIDTSIFIAQEAGREVGQLPDEGTISVITIAELHGGVLRATGARIRAQRLETLARATHEFDAIPIDSDVARVFATILAEAKAAGKRPNVMDVWIAATAVRHGLVVYTRDSDFRSIPRVQSIVAP